MNYSICALMILPVLCVGSLTEAEDLKKATFTIGGLHCPPCVRTVERSLVRMPGVKSATVDWKTKRARLEFDEDKTSAQQIAEGIVTTPHMMGAGMRYDGRLALSVPDLKDEAAAKTAKATIQQVKGVAAVAAFPQQRLISVSFDHQGKVAIRDLLRALDKAGFKAASY